MIEQPTPIAAQHLAFMRRAIALSYESMSVGGGPFGAVVVSGNQIIGLGTNRVVIDHDPTAHAEIVAIRAACASVGSHALQNAIIYTNCEPCPMCLAAIWWSRISGIYYANTRDDAARIDFDDAAIYAEVNSPLPNRKIPINRLLADEGRAVFERWANTPDRVQY